MCLVYPVLRCQPTTNRPNEYSNQPLAACSGVRSSLLMCSFTLLALPPIITTFTRSCLRFPPARPLVIGTKNLPSLFSLSLQPGPFVLGIAPQETTPRLLLAALLHNPGSMFIILLLADPELFTVSSHPHERRWLSYLMEAAQAAKNASADPASVLALHRVSRRLQSDPGTRIDLSELLVQAVIKADDQG